MLLGCSSEPTPQVDSHKVLHELDRVADKGEVDLAPDLVGEGHYEPDSD